MITLTERAAKKLRIILEKSSVFNPNAGIRFAVKGGGCSGFSYERLTVSARPHPYDKVFESYGIRIFVDPKSLVIVTGTEIDYGSSDNLLEDWIFNNPNAKSSCGCHKSFDIK